MRVAIHGRGETGGKLVTGDAMDGSAKVAQECSWNGVLWQCWMDAIQARSPMWWAFERKYLDIVTMLTKLLYHILTKQTWTITKVLMF